jgi:hypothetical protein
MKASSATLAAALLALAACGRMQDNEQTAQAAGDVLASLDESTLDGQIATRGQYLNSPRLEKKSLLGKVGDLVVSPAYAATCGLFNRFSECSGGVRSKDFGSCSYNGLTFSGTVSLTFSDATACTVNDAGESVTRVADLTVGNKQGEQLRITAPGGGQKLTRVGAGSALYTVLGMNRVLTDSSGAKEFDVSTQTLEDISVTGSSRSDRVANGGKLQITHNLSGYVTELVPENLTWSSSCNCPVSGKLVGNTQGGTGKRTVNKDFTIEVTSCGKATVTVGSDVNEVEFDRCFSN